MNEKIEKLEALLTEAAPIAFAALEANSALPAAQQSPFLGMLHVRLQGAVDALKHHQSWQTAATAATPDATK